MEVNIVKVTSTTELNQFINFPRNLYKSDKNFVFEPISLQKEFFSKKNPFFEHSSVEYYLAKHNGIIVGRIAGITNNVHNKVYNEKTGFFVFFESIDNYEVAKSLFEKVVDLHLKNGFNKIIGPTNFTTNDSCGMLISGFESPAVVMMPYNKQYYNDFLVKYGFTKAMDLSSYFIGDQLFLPAVSRFENRISNKLNESGITIRTINYKMLDQEIVSLRKVYNESNVNNWGFLPLSENEFNHTAYQFKQFVSEKLILIAEKNNKQIGFLVALPDLNQVFSHLRSGKFFPFGFLKYLWYKRKVNNSRILILGVLEEFRNKGLDILLYKRIQENLASLGIYHCEACYVMESNVIMNAILKKINGKCVHKYRIYQIEKNN